MHDTDGDLRQLGKDYHSFGSNNIVWRLSLGRVEPERCNLEPAQWRSPVRYGWVYAGPFMHLLTTPRIYLKSIIPALSGSNSTALSGMVPINSRKRKLGNDWLASENNADSRVKHSNSIN